MDTMKKISRKKPPVYLFIDTNIFLDFYRGNNEANLSLLQKVVRAKEFIISTYQVEMEFKKNRQTVIQETLGNIKFCPKISLPAVFQDTTTSRLLKNLKDDASNKLKVVENRFIKLMKDPKKTDAVYQALEEIFHNPSEHVLTRDMAIRHKTKRLAWRRFLLGYPPRKKNDTSIGDALNWEWLVHCGNNFPGKIIIVTRDADYGTVIKNNSFLNDHLLQEYKERVGPRRPIQLTNKLSVALKELDIKVTKEEASAEQDQLLEDKETSSGAIGVPASKLFAEALIKYFEATNRYK